MSHVNQKLASEQVKGYSQISNLDIKSESYRIRWNSELYRISSKSNEAVNHLSIYSSVVTDVSWENQAQERFPVSSAPDGMFFRRQEETWDPRENPNLHKQ